MKKENLKDFQVVVLRNGLKGVVMLKYKESCLPAGLREDFGVRTTDFAILFENYVLVGSEYKNNLRHRKRKEFDIMKIYGKGYISGNSLNMDTTYEDVIWERQDD